jgi:hypothetical protein
VALQLNPLLLELFESVYQDLARALETRQRLSDVCGDHELANAAGQLERIAKLEVAMAALEGALDRRENGILH